MAARTVVASSHSLRRVGPGPQATRACERVALPPARRLFPRCWPMQSPRRVAAPGAESRFRESPPVWAESPVCKAQSPFGKGPSRPSRGPSRPSCVVPVAPFAVPVGPSRSQWERETSHSAKGDSDQASTRSSSSSSSSSEFRVQSLFEQNNSKPTKLSSSPDSSNSSSSSAHRWLALVALQAPKPSVSTRGGGGRAW